eukprot:TRINITY_DN6015_c1_g3_i1.p1 TRINITY_DN6015_c1_g3~~TRINITY_DN6015_c1_g3_i1.p1  ORF type:complete len:490 (+),score=63.68 TRINITY_DN6015_c1_g3_i1:39-1508(+)
MKMTRVVRSAASLPSFHVPASVMPSDLSLVKHLEKAKTAEVSTLSNGFRVATRDTGGETASVGIWIDAGSRFENLENNGVAHFLEHMTFRGTKNRTRMQIDSYFEHSGSHLNAYTTREQTVYFIRSVGKEIGPCMEILADILRNPLLRSHDIENERDIIMTEKADVEKTIDEVMMDHVHLSCFPDDGLGLTILGLVENIEQNINADMIREYIRLHYTAKRMVMVGCGGVDHDQLVNLSERLWGDLPTFPEKPTLNAKFKGDIEKLVPFDTESPHLSMCWGICGQAENEMMICQIIQFIIGEWNREAEDQPADSVLEPIITDLSQGSDSLIQSISAFTTPYSDQGIFGFYMISSKGINTPEEDFKKFQLEVLRRILLAIEKLDERRLNDAKMALKCSILMQVDGHHTATDVLGSYMLSHGRDMPLVEIYGRIDACTLEAVRDTLAKYILEKPFTLTGVGPESLFPKDQAKDYVWNRDATFTPAAYGAARA